MIPKRPNKLAQGMTRNENTRIGKGKKRISNPQHPDYNRDLSRLMVLGTTDELGKLINYSFKRITKNHPTDMGYAKQVYILSDFGKLKLQRMRYEKKMKEQKN